MNTGFDVLFSCAGEFLVDAFLLLPLASLMETALRPSSHARNASTAVTRLFLHATCNGVMPRAPRAQRTFLGISCSRNLSRKGVHSMMRPLSESISSCPSSQSAYCVVVRQSLNPCDVRCPSSLASSSSSTSTKTWASNSSASISYERKSLLATLRFDRTFFQL